MAEGSSYQFGPYRLDGAGHVLFRDGKMVALPPKAIETLLVLVENAGKVVGKEELLKRIWADAFVEEGSLTRVISVLREALTEESFEEGYIVTIPKRGYRFAAPVVSLEHARPVPTARESGKQMLAVLPFENLSGDKRQEYFSDGLTEEMITQLGSLDPERLGVIARTSAMQYKSTQKSIQQVGHELGVSFVLEGSVRRAGKRVRIAAQLIQVSDQTHLWAQSYDRDLGDVLTIQSEVARATAAQIVTKLAPGEEHRATATDAIDPDAYDAYLRGRYLWNKRTREALLKSLACFEAALRHSPRYAAAYVGLADSYLTLQDFGHMPSRKATAKAKAVAAKALAIDESMAEAHNSVAHAHFHEFHWREAEREFRRAIELNPSYAVARFYYSNYLIAMGRIEEAGVEARAAQLSDPMSLPVLSNVATAHYYARRYEQAAGSALRALKIDPTYAQAYEDLGRVYEQQGRYEEAIASLAKAVRFSRRSPGDVASLAFACAAAGRRKQAIKLLQELKQRMKQRHVSAYAIALVHVGLGEHDQAFSWLNKAYDERSSTMPFIATNPRLVGLRRDKRFSKLVRQLRLPAQDRVFGAESPAAGSKR